jgi:heparosan-N-sulfate-glucuronate 5-epimerase
VRERKQAPRGRAGLFSSSRTFFLPVGQHIDAEAVRGYPIDMSVKADSQDIRSATVAPPHGLHVVSTQYGLGCYERWLSGDGEEWLQAAVDVARHLVAIQEDDGSWLHRIDYPHTFPLTAPWRSAMAQGEAASLLVRVHQETGEPQFASAAVAALSPMYKLRSHGGVAAPLEGDVWLEEYPTDPPSYVLNGAIFALWGLRDVAVGLDDPAARAGFATGVNTLAANLWRFDTGWWSLYSLYPHPVRNVASSFYHDLHINQLAAMQLLAPRSEFASTQAQWQRYSASGVNRRRAFAAKAGFRLLIPRRRRLIGRVTAG